MKSEENNKEEKPKRILRMSAEEASSFKETRERERVEKEEREERQRQEAQESENKDKDDRERGGSGDRERGDGGERGGYGGRDRSDRDRGGYGGRDRGGRDRGGYGGRDRGGRERGDSRDRGGRDRDGYGGRERGGSRDRGGRDRDNEGRGDRGWDKDRPQRETKDRNNVHLYLSPRVLALAEEFAEELNVPVSKYLSDIIKLFVFSKADERPQHDRYRTEFVSQNKLKTTGWTPESPSDTDTQELDTVRDRGQYKQGQVEARNFEKFDGEKPTQPNSANQTNAETQENQAIGNRNSENDPTFNQPQSQIETRDDLDRVTSAHIEAASAIQTEAGPESKTTSDGPSDPQEANDKSDLKKRVQGKGYRSRPGKSRGRESSSNRGQRKRNTGSRGPKSGKSSGSSRSKSSGKKSYGRSAGPRGRANAQAKKRRNNS